ncbi:M20/M25/M40 family metallo-hydrolase [Labedaea rhizosphaerae]|uniref:Peptidase M28-like protein n=1 Tax=Labedaea rhizosphaerae TaxID=598644 RepID=A0A4R6S7G2_LABRH|nr:M20/M25/M40 family metallo-hydrolase [Labedaea rhizosphaerae]TDP95187.1 peptidase M28-like protein [Labedaea rhizosphaerae]
MSNRLVAWVVFVVLAALGVLTALSLQPSSPRDRSAPPGEFSAERAIARLGPVAAVSHPQGSAENAKVRDYLLGQLRDLGLAPTTDTRLAVRAEDDWPVVAANVTDLHATIKGTAPTGRVLLVAHYDSVPGGPGAADDGANVVSILEIVRALKASAPLRNDVEVLLTDGEEADLLGAQAFVDAGGARDKNTVVVNMEARGTSGPAIIFQTVGGNSGVMSAVGAGDAVATSVSDDVYKMLPNDTDLTVFDNAGLRGINYAFVGDSVNYHTPHDDLAHLSHATVQDMGASALAAVRSLGGADLAAMPDRNDSYFTVLGLFLHYPAWLVIPLAVLAFVLFGLALWYHGLRPGRIARSALTFVLPILGAVVVGAGVWFLLRLLRPEYALFVAGDTNRPFFYALGMVLLTLVLLVLWCRWQRKRLSMIELTFVVLGWLTFLALVTAFLVPGGSYVFTWPVLIGSAALLAARRWAYEDSSWAMIAASAAAVPAVLLGLPMILLLFPLVGISVAVAPLVLVVLFGATVLGLFAASVPQRVLTVALVVAGLGAVVALGTGLAVDSYDEQYPKPVSLGYGLDGDTGKAYWISAGDPADRETNKALRRLVPLPPFPSVAGKRHTVGALAPLSKQVVVPSAEVLSAKDNPDGTHTAVLELHAGPAATELHLYVMSGELVSATVNGAPLATNGRYGGRWGMIFTGPPPEGVTVTLVSRGGPLTTNVTAVYRGLPEDADAPYLGPGVSFPQYSPLSGQTIAERTYRA